MSHFAEGKVIKMDLTILFTMGLVAGTAVGLVTSRKSRKSRSRSNMKRKSSVKPKRRVDLPKTKKTDRKPFLGPQISSFRVSQEPPLEGAFEGPALPTVIKSTSAQETLDREATPSTADQPKVQAFSACPSCGLETSDVMMSEHFLNSPSHRLGRKEFVDEQEEKNSLHEEKPLTAEEHNSGVMRSLLSMLAPPRAFGRRHMQQNENPFSDLIQQRMQAGHFPVPKTLPLDN
jgi:hypothetical protein